MAHRAMAVTEMRTVGGLDLSESASSQCRPCRIQKDNKQMDALSRKTYEFCNPFGDNVSTNSLTNLATGKLLQLHIS